VTDPERLSEGGNLPLSLTSLVGRHHELAALEELSENARALVLVGTGGSGKTRLALALAELLAPRFDGGVWWVDLGGLNQPELVPSEVATALGLTQRPGEDTLATIQRHLRLRSALVVLDNCEHLAEATAQMMDGLLRACPALRLLATSRELLGVTGEVTYRVDGLACSPGADEGAVPEAVELFLARAWAAVPRLKLPVAQRSQVIELCRRLDGLPLAIELAAARLRVLSVGEIIKRLDDDLSLLRHPSRSVPARHQTLRATLEWSYRFLSPGEQAVFRRLAVFSPTFSLLAAESVAAGDEVGRGEVLDLITGLVDKSLVQVADRGAEHRYRLLETVRQFGRDLLFESGEERETLSAHATFYFALAEQAEASLEGPDQSRWLDRLEIEHDNLRAVLARTLGECDVVGARLATALWPFWYLRGHYNEAREWLEQAIGIVANAPAEVRAETFRSAGVVAFLQCDYALAGIQLSTALELFEAANDRVGVARTLQNLGSVAREQGRYGESRLLHERSREIWADLEHDAGIAASLDYLGFVAWLEGEHAAAVELSSEAVATFASLGRSQELAAAQINLGVALHYGGEESKAKELLARALASSRSIGYQEGIAWALHSLALVAGDGSPAEVEELLGESLSTHFSLGDRWRASSVLESVAELLVKEEEEEQAVVLLAAADALRSTLGTPIPPAETMRRETAYERAKRKLSSARFASAWDAGVKLSLEEAVQSARGSIERARLPAGERAGLAFQLTGREVAVLQLVAAGLTNEEIGRRLHISRGTAGVHVSNILRKLGVTSRVQAAGVAHRLGLGQAGDG
jgi:predicted ATPase/DNA-binding CsgD family transcriptional regulator